MIDDKLKKLLESPGLVIQTGNRKGDDPYHQMGNRKDCPYSQEMIQTLLSETDLLVFGAPGSGKTALALSILQQRDPAIRAWYVSPRLTAFSAARLTSGLTEAGKLDGVSLRRPEGLWGLNLDMPDLLIVDDLQDLVAPDSGPDLEMLMLKTPAQVAVLYLCDLMADQDAVLDWLANIRPRPCQRETPYLPAISRIGALWTPPEAMTPLVDRKRVANKAKKLIKAHKPLDIQVIAETQIRDLVQTLRNDGLIPALVVMPWPQQCDRAAEACPKVTSGASAGDLLTHPRISGLLDDEPFLKDYKALHPLLSQRAAACHPDHHPLWNRLAEEALSLGRVDAVFATPETAGKMTSRFQSLVLATSNCGNDRRLLDWEMDRLFRLAGRREMDQAGCIVALNTSEVDLVFIKDQLVRPPRPLTSGLRCDIRTALAVLSMEDDPEAILKKTLNGTRYPKFAAFCAEALTADMAEELPHPGCSGHIQTVAGLKDLRLRLELGLSRLDDQIRSASGKHRRRLINEKKSREFLLERLPCNDCPHCDMCHARGTKRFRETMAAYYEMMPRLRESFTGLWLDFVHARDCLSFFDLVAEPSQSESIPPTGSAGLSRLGRLAHRTGLKIPQMLTACIQDRTGSGRFFSDEASPAVEFALAGGFLEIGGPGLRHPRSAFPELSDELAEGFAALDAHWESLAPVLDPVRDKLLYFGIAPQDCRQDMSAALLAWRLGVDQETLEKATGMAPGPLARMVRQAIDLWNRLKTAAARD